MISEVLSYKIVEEDPIEFPSPLVYTQLQTFLMYSVGDQERVNEVQERLSSFIHFTLNNDTESASFISIYDGTITPASFAGFALVNWRTLEGDKPFNESYLPTIICPCPPYEDTFYDSMEVATVLQKYIRGQAEARYALKEVFPL